VTNESGTSFATSPDWQFLAPPVQVTISASQNLLVPIAKDSLNASNIFSETFNGLLNYCYERTDASTLSPFPVASGNLSVSPHSNLSFTHTYTDLAQVQPGSAGTYKVGLCIQGTGDVNPDFQVNISSITVPELLVEVSD
jgi:hypothetical protein